MRRYAVLFIVLFLVSVHAHSQRTIPPGSISKEQLLELARTGGLNKFTPDDIRQKLKEMGISEDEAIQMAKDRGVDLRKYLNPTAAVDTTKINQQQLLQPSTGVPPPQGGVTPPTVPTAPAVTAAIETTKTLLPDTTQLPRGAFGLEYFGYKLFKKIPTAFAPNEVGPIDPGYLIGTGDILLLSVWGQAEFQYQLEVDREGRVFIPNVGQVFVSGTPLRNLQEKLTNQLSKYYSGLASKPQTVFLDVTIAKLRPLRVFVMGELAQPGGYTISSYATVFNALYAVGGPRVKGSLRGVKVIRDNQVVAVIDLYDYLLKGDRTSDIRLQNNDVIFIPPRLSTVSIRGEVSRSAIYELKTGEDISALIDFAGGLLPTAYTEKCQIERIKPLSERKGGVVDREIVDVKLRDYISKSGKKFPMFDGDVVEVYPILGETRNYVYIDGPVWRPGRYEMARAQTLKQLIASAEGLQPKTYLPVAHIIRENEDLITTRIIPFDLGNIMDGTAPDVALQPRDSIYLYSTEVVQIKDRYVTIFGEVKKPGKYRLHDNMTLADLILAAGGYTQEAYLLAAEVARVRPEGMSEDTLAILLYPPLPREFSKIASQRFADSARIMSSSDFILLQRDEVLIKPNPDYKEQQNVTILGDVMYPGVYAIEKRGERLSELLTRAGGPTKTSYFGGSALTRDGKRLLVDFEEAFYKKNKLHDVLMFGGDSISIPSSPHTVQVDGEVNNPGVLSFIDGSSALSYIDRAGGLTDSSNYAVLVKPTGETQRVNFGFLRTNPDVPEGSRIRVTKVPPPAPEGKGLDISGTIKDTFAILTSAATLAFLIYQVTK